jgi:hypothetical protein
MKFHLGGGGELDTRFILRRANDIAPGALYLVLGMEAEALGGYLEYCTPVVLTANVPSLNSKVVAGAHVPRAQTKQLVAAK